MFHIDLDTPTTQLQDYLNSHNWLVPNEKLLSLEKPGEGNMNVVLRVHTNVRSFILKQSRPYVQKYQQIEAPLERIEVEHQFYEAIQNDQIKDHIPRILAHNKSEHLLMMEDLGECQDMTTLYDQRKIENESFERLIQIVNTIHNSNPTDFPKNLVLRRLNHQHMFVLPFLEDNGFQLDEVQEGLQDLSLPYKRDKSLVQVVQSLGEKYLSQGKTLLHGDYYPGSWMAVGDKVFVIDPEFSFMGFAEFDLGVMAAHLTMATQDHSYLNRIIHAYQRPVDTKLVAQMAGIEIMRRLIGLAQLPLKRSLEEKDLLMQMAKKMILD